jgi:hypothetical protein
MSFLSNFSANIFGKIGSLLAGGDVPVPGDYDGEAWKTKAISDYVLKPI